MAAPVLRSVRRLRSRQRLAVVLVEQRLGVEGVDLRRPAVHEQVDDVLGLGREVRLLRAASGSASRRELIVGQHAGQAEDAEAGAARERAVRGGRAVAFQSRGQDTRAPSIHERELVGHAAARGRRSSPAVGGRFDHERQRQLRLVRRPAAAVTRPGRAASRRSPASVSFWHRWHAASRFGGVASKRAVHQEQRLRGDRRGRALRGEAGRVRHVERASAAPGTPADRRSRRPCAGVLPPKSRTARPAELRVEAARDGQQRIVQRLEVQPLAVQLPQQAVLRIDCAGRRGGRGSPACRWPRVMISLCSCLDATSRSSVHELRGEPVEQFRVRRRVAAQAEVAGRADQAACRSGASRRG